MNLATSHIIILLQHVLIGFIGCVGNIFVLLVYMKRLKENEICTLFILYLAITDLTCCLLLVPINCYVEILDTKVTSDFLCKFHHFLSISNITYSCFLMTLVAVERYFSIIWPMHTIINKYRAKILTIILLISCVIIALVGGLGVGIDHKVKIVDNNYSYDNATISNSTNSEAAAHEFSDYNNHTNHFIEIWWRTDECFPNDLIIKREAMAYIRLIQNSLIVICFFIIFILYAIIYINVSKRRQLKQERDVYYKRIVNRSKQLNSNINNIDSKNNKLNENGGVAQALIDPANPLSNNSITQQTFYLSSPDYNKDDLQMVQFDFKENREECPDAFINRKESKALLQKPSIVSFHEQANSLITLLNNDGVTESTNIQKPVQDSPKPTEEHKNNKKPSISQSTVTTTTVSFLNNNVLMANIKTAFMLFIVTVIMAIVFTPALLISFGVIQYDVIFWNLYLINNACNPIVYSFLNANFRNSLKHLICIKLLKKRRGAVRK